MSDRLGRMEGTPRKRSVTPDVTQKTRPPAMRAIRAGRSEALVMTFLLLAVLAMLGFLCFTGPEGFIGPRHRHWAVNSRLACKEFYLCGSFESLWIDRIPSSFWPCSSWF